MTLSEVQSFVVKTIKGAFTNKKTLDKLSTSNEGKLLYNNQDINRPISKETENIIELKPDGLYATYKLSDEELNYIINKVLSVLMVQTNIETKDSGMIMTSDDLIIMVKEELTNG